MPLTLERWQIQLQALQAMVEIAMTAGGKLAIQPNQDGTTGIQNVELATPPVQNKFPCIGISFEKFDEKPYGQRTHTISSRFTIVLAVYRAYDAAVTDTEAQALADLTNYINDGNGNGLSVVLRADPTLQGNANYGYIASMERTILTSDSAGAGAVAAAVYDYVAEDQVRF